MLHRFVGYEHGSLAVADIDDRPARIPEAGDDDGVALRRNAGQRFARRSPIERAHAGARGIEQHHLRLAARHADGRQASIVELSGKAVSAAMRDAVPARQRVDPVEVIEQVVIAANILDRREQRAARAGCKAGPRLYFADFSRLLALAMPHETRPRVAVALHVPAAAVFCQRWRRQRKRPREDFTLLRIPAVRRRAEALTQPLVVLLPQRIHWLAGGLDRIAVDPERDDVVAVILDELR